MGILMLECEQLLSWTHVITYFILLLNIQNMCITLS